MRYATCHTKKINRMHNANTLPMYIFMILGARRSVKWAELEHVTSNVVMFLGVGCGGRGGGGNFPFTASFRAKPNLLIPEARSCVICKAENEPRMEINYVNFAPVNSF